jgi:hypothetical protein
MFRDRSSHSREHGQFWPIRSAETRMFWPVSAGRRGLRNARQRRAVILSSAKGGRDMYYTPDDLTPRHPERIDYSASRSGGGGWRILIGIAALIILALLVFGPGGTTTDVHPGGAGAPPVVVQEDPAPVAPAAPAY